MDFNAVSRLSTLLSKTFAENFLRLLVIHKDMSASEAASRLNLHIKTAQDFLDKLSSLAIAEKRQVFESKRPYNRYTLVKRKIRFEFDLQTLYDNSVEKNLLNQKIRERKNSGALFATSGNNDYISAVTVSTGEGRKRKERKINLTSTQGKFLFHLPFPSAPPLSIKDIIEKAGVNDSFNSEMLNIVQLLYSLDIIEYFD